MSSKNDEISLLQLQIKQLEIQFDKSMSENEEFAKTKLIFNELQKMIEKLDNLKKQNTE